AGVVLALLTPVSERLEHALAPWSAGLVVPVFALTSAGVAIGGNGMFDDRVFWGVLLGLVVGKPLGIAAGTLATGALTGRRWNDSGAGLRDLVGLGFIAGIGFTVALLVSDLAYADERIADAKTAALTASAVAAVIGVLVLGLRRETAPGTAEPADAAG
ncbi:MAG: Na+/H+ antiporter NhaA, partial [Marmoricola sp.]